MEGTATGEDVKISLETYTGLSLTEFFSQWYYGQGYPIYDVAWDHRNDSLYIDVSQMTSHSSVDLFTIPMPISATLNGQDTIIRLTPMMKEESFRIYLPGQVRSLSFDPEGYLIKKVNSIRNMGITSTDDFPSNSMEVFPNPAKDIITVRMNHHIPATLRLSDIQGRSLQEWPDYPGNELKINAGDIPPGIYLISAEINGRTIRKTLLIQ